MAGRRPSAVLLLSWALLAGASYFRREDLFSAAPLVEFPAPSRLRCANWCNARTGCIGLTFTANGSCQLFDQVLSVSTEPTDVQVQYIRLPCSPGWYLYGDSCYLRRFSGGLDWEESRAACRRLGEKSDLASLNDEEEQTWMMLHPSRPSTSEYIGLKREDGILTNVDGTSPSFKPSLLYRKA